MNRFRNKTDRGGRLTRFKMIYLLCPLLLLVFMIGLSSINQTTIDKQRDSLETAINRNIIHCYAVEGFYPPSLSYMEDHYGLIYNKDLFFVDYQPIGSNIRPNVTILKRK